MGNRSTFSTDGADDSGAPVIDSMTCPSASAGEPPSTVIDAASRASLIAQADQLLHRFGQAHRHGKARQHLDEFLRAAFADRRETMLADRFRLLAPLGEGGFGFVCLALDTRLERQVALKFPKPEFLLHDGYRQKLLREAQVAAGLDHPGIVKVHEVIEEGDLWFIVSGYCEGPSLAGWLRQHGEPVPPRLAARMVLQIAEAVDYAHKRGLLHRDLKPSNVLLSLDPASTDAQPRLLLTDFGLAARYDADAKPGGRVSGTLPYMAPEIFDPSSGTVGVAADTYALGVILFELLAGSPPLTVDSSDGIHEILQQKRRPMPQIRSRRPDVPPDLNAICRQCLQAAPEARYETTGALADDLRRFLTGRPVAARPVGPARAFYAWTRRHPLTAGLMLATLASLLIGGAISLRQWRRAQHQERIALASLQKAEDAVVWLGWAIEDALFWAPTDTLGSTQRARLTHYYADALNQRSVQETVRPIDAAAHCFFARLDLLDGKYDDAEPKLRRALVEWHDINRRHPDHALYRRALARTLYCYGQFRLTLRNEPDGMQQIRDGRLFGEFAVNDPADRPLIAEYAELLLEKGDARVERRLSASPAPDFRASLALSSLLCQAEPRPEDRFRLTRARMALSSVLHHNDAAEIRLLRTSAMSELRKLVREEPHNDAFRLELASALTRLCRRQDPSDEDWQRAEEAIGLLSPLVDRPSQSEGNLLYAKLRFMQARYLARKKDARTGAFIEKAGAAFLRAMDLNECSTIQAASNLYKLGTLSVSLNHADLALGWLGQAEELYSRNREGLKGHRTLQIEYARCLAALAALLNQAGDQKAAIAKYEAAVRFLESAPESAKPGSPLREEWKRLRVRLEKTRQSPALMASAGSRPSP